MTFVGIIGLLLGMLAFPIAMIERSRLRISFFAIAFLLHAASAVVYYLYVQTSSADTAMYYYDPFDLYTVGFGTSTLFVVYIVQFLKSIVGGTYLDYFFIFQAFGFFGVALLMRSIEEIYTSLQVPQPLWAYLIVLLPGMQFWTSAIGKDGLLFTACCLAVWAAMQIRRRYVALGVAILLMLMVRPHIALVAVVAVAWAALTDRATHPLLRVLLITGSLGTLALAASSMKATFELDLTNADSVSDFLAMRTYVMMSSDAGNTAVVNAAYPVRLMSFLFRPLFLDAEGVFGYIASAENTLFLIMAVFVVINIRTVRATAKAEPFVRYALVSSVGITLMLAIDYYNVGLGLRQKTMVLPGFIIAVVVLAAVRHARRRRVAFIQPARAGTALV